MAIDDGEGLGSTSGSMGSASAGGMRTATNRCQVRRAAEARVRIGLERAGRQVKHGLRRRGPDEGLEERGAVRDDGDVADFLITGDACTRLRGQQIGGGHVLRGEDAVHAREGELPLVVKKIRKMRLAEAGLSRQKRDAERAPLNSADQFQAEVLVHLGKFMCGTSAARNGAETVSICLQQSDLR